MADIKVKLINTALQIIGEKGTLNVGVRDITEKAGVNVAAINYHFKNKELFFEEIEAYIIEKNNKIYTALENSNAIEAIQNWSELVLDSVLKNPGILVVVQRLLSSSKDKHIITREYYDNMDQRLDEVLFKVLGEKNFKVKKNIFMSSLIFPATLSSQSVSGIQHLKEMTVTERQNYIKELLSLLQ